MSTRNLFRSSDPCIDERCVEVDDFVTHPVRIPVNFDLLAGASAHSYTSANRLKIIMPDTNQITQCGVERRLDGQFFHSGKYGGGTAHVTPDGG
jgi:hypothetical protein